MNSFYLRDDSYGSTALEIADHFKTEESDNSAFRNADRNSSGMLFGEGVLADVLGLDDTSPHQAILDRVLFDLIAELAVTPGKRSRGQRVMFS